MLMIKKVHGRERLASGKLNVEKLFDVGEDELFDLIRSKEKQ